MKKTLSLLMAVILISGMAGIFSIPVSAATVISNTQPAIPANVGEKIVLGNYSVTLDSGTVLNNSQITWFNGSTQITEFTPSAAGVTQLTAKSGTSSKTIYVVAKAASDTEYVLYLNDFTNAASLDGFKKISADSFYTVEDGKLVMNAVGTDTLRIILPAWLGDFGDYRIDSKMSQSNAVDTGRWFSTMYRISNENNGYYPYYHMCVRNDTTLSNGIEFAARTPANGWDVVYKGSSTQKITYPTFYNFSVLAKENVVQYLIDGKSVMYVTDATANKKGMIGFHANYSKIYVDSVKVTLQLTKPEAPPEPDSELINVGDTTSANTHNNIATLEALSDKSDIATRVSDGINIPSSVLFYVKTESGKANVYSHDNKLQGTLDSYKNLIAERAFIPSFYVYDKAAVDSVVSMLGGIALKDALFVSADGDIVKYARQKMSIARGAVDFTGITDALLTPDKLLGIRGDVNKALSSIAIISSAHAKKDYVSELQSNAITVWVMDNGDMNDTAIATVLTSGASGVISKDSYKIDTAIRDLFVAGTLTKTPVIIGHRGNPSQAPENSISGYLKAIENGADVVETDIMLSKDGQIVIMHDSTIDRTTNGSGTVSAMTVEQLKQYSLWGDNDKFKTAYPNEKIPTFEEMLIAIKPTGGKIFIEIKTGATAIVKPMVDLIKKHDMESRVSVICFTASQLLLTQTHMPTMSTGYLLGAPAVSPTIPQALNALYAQMLNIQSANSTMNVNGGNITKNFVHVTAERGITMWPWTYSNAGGNMAGMFVNHFIWGVDGLTTDDAQYVKSTVKNVYTDISSIYLQGKGSAGVYSFKALTYGKTISDITSKTETFIKVIEGADLITVTAGKVTAKADSGTATFMLGYTTKVGSSTYVLYSQPITVYLGTEADLTLIETSAYSSDGIFLTGVTDKTTIGDLLANFNSPESITVLDNAGKIVTDTKKYAGTGFKVVYGTDEELTVVIKGDGNSDGEVNSFDYLMAKRAFMGSLTLTDAQLKALAMTGTPLPTSFDYLLIKRHFVGSYNLYA